MYLVRKTCFVIFMVGNTFMWISAADWFELTRPWAVMWGIVLWLEYDLIKTIFNHCWPEKETYDTP